MEVYLLIMKKRAVYVNDELIDLTYKEYELLKLLMINVGNCS